MNKIAEEENDIPNQETLAAIQEAMKHQEEEVAKGNDDGKNYLDLSSIDSMMEKSSVRQVLADVYEEVNWAYLAKNYFGKSRSWLYHKFNGMNNGVADDFSDIDRERLKASLQDIAGRIMQAADKL